MRTVAETILDQLGGAGHLTAMIGAKSFMAGDSSLTIRFAARAINKASCIVVRLDSSDAYTVECWNIRGVRCDMVSSDSMVYADRLHTVIEGRLGLRLSLGTMGRAS